MAIYDSDGTAACEIRTVFDHDGTADHQIGKGYDHDGTAAALVYLYGTPVTASGSFGRFNISSGGSVTKESYSGYYTTDADGIIRLTYSGNYDGWASGNGWVQVNSITLGIEINGTKYPLGNGGTVAIGAGQRWRVYVTVKGRAVLETGGGGQFTGGYSYTATFTP